MQADILLVTVTDAEARAVFTALSAQTGHKPDRKFLGDKTYYDLSQIGGGRVWLVRSEQGTAMPGGALVTAHMALGAMRPAAVILVGVAFGTSPQRQRLGDVLVATQLQLYEPQRVGSDPAGQLRIAPRGDKAAVSPKLLDRCRDGALFWPEERAQVQFGLLLSGEKPIEHPATLPRLLNHEPEALGAEMEGAGLYVAAIHHRMDWIQSGVSGRLVPPLAIHRKAAFRVRVEVGRPRQAVPAAFASRGLRPRGWSARHTPRIHPSVERLLPDAPRKSG